MIKKLLLTIFLMSGIWSTAYPGTLGLTTSSGGYYPGIAKAYIYVREYTAPAGPDLIVDTFYIEFRGAPVATDTFVAAVYSMTAGVPDARIGNGILAGVTTTGVKAIPMSLTITGGQTVCLGIGLTSNSTSGAIGIYGDNTITVNGCFHTPAGDGTSGAVSPFGGCNSGSVYSSQNPITMYVHYNPSGGGGGGGGGGGTGPRVLIRNKPEWKW